MKTPPISPSRRRELQKNKLFGKLPMRFRARAQNIEVPASFENRFAFYNTKLYLKDGRSTRLKFRDLKLSHDPIPLKPKHSIQDFYRTIDMPSHTDSLVTLLEAAAEWHYCLGNKLGEEWNEAGCLRDTLAKITEREQEQLFESIKPSSITHSW